MVLKMRIPYGTKYSVRIEVNLWRQIRCESCECEFAYRQKIFVSGEATNFLWLDKQRAIFSAQSQAYDALSRQIKHISKSAHKIYACPKCGIYQAEMVEIMKNRRSERIIGTGILIGFSLPYK
jgi:ribosomal protein L37AE/L43A